MSAPTALRRRLTRWDLIVYGLLFIGPLAPVGVYGVLDARTNGAVALVYVAGIVVTYSALGLFAALFMAVVPLAMQPTTAATRSHPRRDASMVQVVRWPVC